MGRALISGLAIGLLAGSSLAQVEEPPSDNRMVLGNGNDLLASGANAIRAGAYDEGIRLTTLGLERRTNSDAVRAAALSNLCAAYAAKGLPDLAIQRCTESIGIDSGNWRAWSNRSYAYWLKRMYPEARFDLDTAAAINPRARQVAQIRGMINEAGLRPRVTMEEHQ
jgi:tetratricopeptide (TPR) repeat protein